MIRFRIFIAFCLFLVLTSGRGFTQDTENPTKLSVETPTADTGNATSSPRENSRAVQLQFVGIFQPDGLFVLGNGRRTVKFDPGGSERVRNSALRSQVPGFVNLEGNEKVISNFKPPYHASRPVKGHSLLANLRDRIVVLAYGRQNVLIAPTHIATDSKQRLIITDPDLAAVHVLDAAGKTAFRIQGGPSRRFQSPEGVAVDAGDNIYVADGRVGTVEVFDPEGHFLRTIGTFRGERMFERPTGIAINKDAGLLYVLDSPANELVVFDLKGNLLQRVGSRSKVALDYPTEIAVAGDRVVILDDFGARVQVLDARCNLTSAFRVKVHQGAPKVAEIGLAVDHAGRIYLSNLFPDSVAAFDQSGKLIGMYGHSGTQVREFRLPGGMWVDATDRIYIADTDNSRVQVFQSSEIGDQRTPPIAGARTR